MHIYEKCSIIGLGPLEIKCVSSHEPTAMVHSAPDNVHVYKYCGYYSTIVCLFRESRNRPHFKQYSLSYTVSY